ncbi:MAG TPA: right-handed parallel beta-helix repeat-containing protein [Lacipirellulaceae bacterium]|nr:right-handed parallel beta-helix repeat-containing protein [Lacipirellulaceae bacterium]
MPCRSTLRSRLVWLPLVSLVALLHRGPALAATAEVTKSGSNFIVRVDGAQTYSGTDYADALQNAAGTGNRIMNVRVSGTLSKQVRLRVSTTFNYLTSSYMIATTNVPAIYAYKSSGIRIDGLKMNGYPTYGIRLSSCPSPSITNVSIDFNNATQPAVAIRVDSEGSTRTSGLYVRNVSIYDMASGDKQGLETYSIDNYDIDGVRASSIGGCGVLINDGRNGKIGTVTADNCGKGTTYAGLRFANNCSGATVGYANVWNSSRGVFILNSTNITVSRVTISDCPVDSIWIQNGSNNRVNSGDVWRGKRPTITNSPGSAINVVYHP